MTTDTIRIAMIDDDQEDYLLTQELLNTIPHRKYILDWYPSSSQGWDALQNHNYDVYLIDYHLDGKTGIELISDVNKNELKKSIILLTGHRNFDIDMAAMNSGASDFLYKDQLTSENLERSIRYCLKRAKDFEILKEAEKLKLEKTATEASIKSKTMF